ncbi:2Fe-2S iron-sulfur cluster-binding protein [Nonomuraea sp. NPDC047529]|uniref:(2Fe-2S)-binding protein n=1 Tax=Nonomuraea sp. NPDC047529 TaxID=3155623 RepID=UPI0033F4871D
MKTVLLDGRRVVACLTPAVTAEGAAVTIVEGPAGEGELPPLQRAFIALDGFPCGYRTSGQLCSAVGMLAEHAAGRPGAVTADVSPDGPAPALDAADVRDALIAADGGARYWVAAPISSHPRYGGATRR